MKTLLLAATLALAVLACGCTSRTAQPAAPSPSSIATTETIPGRGERATLIQDQLKLTVEVTSTTVPRRQGFTVRVSLTNTGGAPVHWDDFRFGWHGRTAQGGTMNSLSAPLIAVPAGRTIDRSFTLASHETTELVRNAYNKWSGGEYQVIGEFGGRGGPSGLAPEIIVHMVN